MKNTITKIFNKLCDAIFPENLTCIVCGEELNEDKRYNICDNCIDNIDFLVGNTCYKCGARTYADSTICSDCKKNKRIVDKNYSAVTYEGNVKRLIHALKYDNKRFLSHSLGKILDDLYIDVVKDFQPDIIIPVPLNISRINVRGYNQTILLLDCLSKDKDLINIDCLIRIKDTPHQASLPKEKRNENVKGAFQVVDKDIINGKNILLVDDIFTTGATIDECAKVLYKAGAKLVRSMTLANSHNDKLDMLGK